MDQLAFDCPSCGQRHTGLPALVYGAPSLGPDEAGNPAPLKRIGEDFCTLNDEHFFVRCVLEIPITGHALPLEWGVWASLSEANYRRYWDSFDDSDQSKLGGMFSYLMNEIQGYPGSFALRCNLMPQDDRKRPLLELQDDQDHPLVRDQMNGIGLERAVELAMPALHPRGRA